MRFDVSWPIALLRSTTSTDNALLNRSIALMRFDVSLSIALLRSTISTDNALLNRSIALMRLLISLLNALLTMSTPYCNTDKRSLRWLILIPPRLNNRSTRALSRWSSDSLAAISTDTSWLTTTTWALKLLMCDRTETKSALVTDTSWLIESILKLNASSALIRFDTSALNALLTMSTRILNASSWVILPAVSTDIRWLIPLNTLDTILIWSSRVALAVWRFAISTLNAAEIILILLSKLFFTLTRSALATDMVLSVDVILELSAVSSLCRAAVSTDSRWLIALAALETVLMCDSRLILAWARVAISLLNAFDTMSILLSNEFLLLVRSALVTDIVFWADVILELKAASSLCLASVSTDSRWLNTLTALFKVSLIDTTLALVFCDEVVAVPPPPVVATELILALRAESALIRAAFSTDKLPWTTDWAVLTALMWASITLLAEPRSYISWLSRLYVDATAALTVLTWASTDATATLIVWSRELPDTTAALITLMALLIDTSATMRALISLDKALLTTDTASSNASIAEWKSALATEPAPSTGTDVELVITQPMPLNRQVLSP